jgi:transcriptional regulator with XRE-family HTH domain
MKVAILPKKWILPAQCRAARALLNISRKNLAARAEVGERTLVDFERGARAAQKSTLAAIRRALEDVGVEFIFENGGSVGVRLKARRAE